MHDAAHERRFDDLFRLERGRDQLVQVDAGFDAQLMAQENRVLGADIASNLRANKKITHCTRNNSYYLPTCQCCRQGVNMA